MDVQDRYLERIAYAGTIRQNEATLTELAAAHAATIPFENVASATGVGARSAPVSMEPSALVAKMLDSSTPRGGYCLEHAGLLVQALPRLGFPARHALGRTFLSPDGAPSGRTHNVVISSIGGRDYLVDVGLGGLTPTAPLALDRYGAQPTPHGDYRIVPATQSGADLTNAPDVALMVQARLHKPEGAQWSNLYAFSTAPVTDVDREIANWYIATSPDSPFTGTLAAALAPSAGVRVTISDTTVRRRTPDGLGRRTVGTLTELSDALVAVGVQLRPDELRGVGDELGIA